LPSCEVNGHPPPHLICANVNVGLERPRRSFSCFRFHTHCRIVHQPLRHRCSEISMRFPSRFGDIDRPKHVKTLAIQPSSKRPQKWSS
jgi:hypothetical protein